MMAERHDLGRIGEEAAVGHLEKSGCRILRRNWKAGKFEIDIIAENSEFVIFAEVKTRSGDFKEDPRNAVNREKQKSMILAADNYIRWYNVDKEIRFDVLVIIINNNKMQIDHIENAFYPTLT